MIEYKHVTSSRSLRLTVKVNRIGEVVVTSPPWVPSFIVKRFVEQHTEWITGQLQSRAARAPNQLSVLIFGKEYDKKAQYDSQAPLGVFIQGSSLICNMPEATHDQTWQKAYDNKITSFLKKTARVYLMHRVKQYAEVMHVSYGTITLREQDTRWGSCSSQGNLNFNWRLVHASPDHIDYVVIHELAHRIHMNHSTRFWSLVEQYCPDYLMHRLWFKRFGGTLY